MSSKSFVDVAISQMTTISSQLLLGQDVYSIRTRINSILDQTLEKQDLGYRKPDFLSLKERITSATSEESCSQVVSSSILLFQKHSLFCSLGTFMSEEDAHTILEAIDPHCWFSEHEISLIVTALQRFSARECLDICSLLVKMPPSKSNGDSFFRFVINVSDLVAPTSRVSVINYFSEMFLSRYTVHQLVLLFAKFNNIEDQGQRHAFFTFVISNFKPEYKKRLTLFMAYDALTQKQKEAIAFWYQKIKPEASTQEQKAEILYNLVVVMAPELFVKVDKIFSEQDRSSDVGVVGELLDSIYHFQSIQHTDPLSLDIKEVLQSLDIARPSTYFARLSAPTEEKKYEDQVLIDSVIEFFNEGFDA
ncbi:MAG: hypothetical protein FJZ57_05480, partial [Chlamydiae bacterium]|nr:hypothetical protein [Chlamydiota bacterium]